MTREEFEFWEKAYISLLSTVSDPFGCLVNDSDRALQIWKNKRATIDDNIVTRCKKDNPDLPEKFIKDILESKNQDKSKSEIFATRTYSEER